MHLLLLDLQNLLLQLPQLLLSELLVKHELLVLRCFACEVRDFIVNDVVVYKVVVVLSILPMPCIASVSNRLVLLDTHLVANRYVYVLNVVVPRVFLHVFLLFVNLHLLFLLRLCWTSIQY